MADLPEPEPARADPQAAATGRPARPGLRNQIAENPLLTLLGSIIAVLLVFTLGTTNLRMSDTNARMDRLEDRMDSIEDRVINIDLKLTALIAALNATEEVDAALEGRLLQPDAGE